MLYNLSQAADVSALKDTMGSFWGQGTCALPSLRGLSFGICGLQRGTVFLVKHKVKL